MDEKASNIIKLVSANSCNKVVVLNSGVRSLVCLRVYVEISCQLNVMK